MKNFIKRSDILDPSQSILDDDGTLKIVISMKDEQKQPLVPKNLLVNMVQSMFLDEETADVVFEVSTVEANEDGFKRGESYVTFHAHSLILK